jgi:NAD(P)-dependent dehydrogenase (short-subunit alcohol dehydrogenase family)
LNDETLPGSVAVITGGANGIGRQVCEDLASRGISVHALDIVPPSDQSVPIKYHRVDVTQESEVEACFSKIVADEQRLDYFVSCAAILTKAPFLSTEADSWQRTIDVNLHGTFLCVRAAVRTMMQTGFGRVCLFSSMFARTGGVDVSAYAASKGGILGLARSLALEHAQDNIRVNTVSPALTDTAQPRAHMSDEELAARSSDFPLGRVGSAKDMAEACLFLLSEESSFVTGQDLRVTGGAFLC